MKLTNKRLPYTINLYNTLTTFMDISTTKLEGILLISPKKHEDQRGFFSEVFRTDKLKDHGFTREFVQDNQSLSVEAGVLRGLHYQKPPFTQDKLVRVLRGSILDVAVDIRKGSPTFGEYVAYELSDQNWNQLLVPHGFAHGFLTLEPNTEVHYKCTEYYAPESDAGILWNSPEINIDWGGITEPILSEKDAKLPHLSETELVFNYE
jgi:dTDP-4-dehydrorhamnose 3,5-epimerase